MQKYFIDNNSNTLLIFFTGWGCDEYEFEHLKSDCDVLLLFDYSNLDLDFKIDFFKYKKINLISFSAGVFVASVLNFDFDINTKIAISGNPYLFDEYFGLSSENKRVLANINEKNADDFARNYLVKTDEEWKKFHHSKRSLDSCKSEFDNLQKLYKEYQNRINDIYDFAIIGSDDLLFMLTAQKEFYKNRLKIIPNTRHNMFYKINKYEEIFDLIFDNYQN